MSANDVKEQLDFQHFIAMLNEALKTARSQDIRSRYNTNLPEEERQEELLMYRQHAKKCWFEAKELYCQNKDAFDRIAEDNKENLDLYNTYMGARKVIEDEMTEQLEESLSE